MNWEACYEGDDGGKDKKREKRGSEGVVSFDCFEQADGEAERRWRERGEDEKETE